MAAHISLNRRPSLLLDQKKTQTLADIHAQVALLVVAKLTSAQVFPFGSLQEYFEHQARDGPGTELAAESRRLEVAVDSAATERSQAAEESASVDSVLRSLARELTPPAIASQEATADVRTFLPLPTFHSQRADVPSEQSLPAAPDHPVASSPAPSFDGQESVQPLVSPTYTSPAISTLNNQKSVQHVTSPAYAYASLEIPAHEIQKNAKPIPPAAYDYSGKISAFDSRRSAQPVAAYISPAIPTFQGQGNKYPVYSSPQPAPNPYLTAPKLALKAVPFDTYPYPQQSRLPQTFAPAEPQPTFKPLKLYKNTSAYPKKYKPELEQGKPETPASSTRGLASKKAQFLKEDYPLVKQHKQSAHNIAATKEAARFQKKTVLATQAPARVDAKEAISAKPSAPAVTKLSPSVEQSAAASGFFHNTDGAGERAGIANHHDAVAAGLGPGHDRIEFQMYGQKGPHSYKFGFDTGKGHNRQFRYEERDPHGHVKGHYGFYNNHGKLQIVSYTAHPQHGFQADNNFGHAV